MSFVDTYTEHFQSYRHDVSEKARQYASGLMQAGSRKNMDRMAEVVPESKSRNLQQFIPYSGKVITKPLNTRAKHISLIPSRNPTVKEK